MKKIILTTVIVFVVMANGCGQMESGLDTFNTSSSFQTSAVTTRALTTATLTASCAESGAVNFDPTNLEYLTNPDNKISYRLNVPYGGHDNDADGIVDADVNRDRRGDLDGFKNRRVFDTFYHSTGGKRPVVIYIHGGGFAGGDKCYSYNYRKLPIKEVMQAGANFIAINYRFLGYTPKGKNAPIPYATNKGIITALNDGKRAIQVVRAQASAYNIDRTKIYLMGDSAGGGIALWNATRNNGANKSSSSVIAQQSTRVSGVFAIGPQATYDFNKWETTVFGQSSNNMITRWRYDQYAVNQNGYATNHDFENCYYWNFYGERIDCDDPERPYAKVPVDFYGHADGVKIVLGYAGEGQPAAEPDTSSYQKYLSDTASYRQNVDILRQISSDDPVMYLEALDVPDNVSPVNTNVAYHSKYHVIALKNQAQSVGVQAVGHIGYQRGLNQRDLRAKYLIGTIFPK